MKEQHELISRAEYKTNDFIIPFQFKSEHCRFGLPNKLDWGLTSNYRVKKKSHYKWLVSLFIPQQKHISPGFPLGLTTLDIMQPSNPIPDP